MSDIEIRLFRYFVALAEERHFSHAAPSELDAFVVAETKKWAEIVKFSGAQVDRVTTIYQMQRERGLQRADFDGAKARSKLTPLMFD